MAWSKTSNEPIPDEAFSDELIDACAQFSDDPLGFVLFAFPWNDPAYPDMCPPRGQNEPMGPDTWQTEFLYNLGQKLQAARDANADQRKIIGGAIRMAAVSGHGTGKLQDCREPVLTPDGWRAIGDLRVGDLVASVDGTFTPVTAVFPQGMKRMYRVVMSDGGWTWAGAEHLWWTTTRSERKHGKEGGVRTTAEIADSLTFPNGPTTGLNHQIPTASPIRHAHRDLPMDPYLLGAWLGDGSASTSCAVLTIGLDKVEAIAEAGARITGVGRDNARRATLSLDQRDFLRLAGLLALRSYERFIPHDFLYASIAQRTALLQGLMDTDGTTGNNNLTYTTTSPRLRDDVAELCRSLGGVALVSGAFQKWFMHNGEKRQGRPAWRITLCLPAEISPYRNPTKAARYTPADHRNRHRGLARSIERIEPGEMADAVCIQVAHPSRLYVTRDHIVTHNSTLVAWIVLWFLSCRSHPLIIVSANTAGQLSSTVWRTLAKWKRLALTGPWFDWTATKLAHKAFNEDWYALAVPWSENNAEAFAGKHEANIMFIFDEASKIADIIWETAEGGLTTTGAIFLAFGNGTQNTGRFYELQTKFKHRWDVMKVDSREARFADKIQIEQWAEDYGEDSDFFRVRVKGEFPHSAYSQLISTETISRAQAEFKRFHAKRLTNILRVEGLEALAQELRTLHPNLPLIMSVDVARMGGDQSVIGLRIGRTFFAVAKYRELKLPELVGHITTHHRLLKPTICFIDGGGYGQGVIDAVEELNFEVVAVYFGGNSTSPREFFNRRAEMYKQAERWLSTGGMIDPDDLELGGELREIQYGFAKKVEALQIETKDDMRRRGVSSPDVADTLVMTFYQPVGMRMEAVKTVAEELAELASGDYGGTGGSTTWRSM